ncbi:MAG TPA: hypothetical protein VF599_22420 [Pyrinomonadaceae bacterium]|jgi:single-stranded DNA-specific DHH superfamily exonuclease
MLSNRTEDNFVSKDTSNESVMSWTIDYEDDRRFVRVVARGVYNIDDHMRMLEDVVTRDFWTPGINLLLDESNLDYRGITLEQLREAAARRVSFDARIGSSKTAVVLNSLTDFARARQYELITSGKISAKIEIFRQADKALEWLLA